MESQARGPAAASFLPLFMGEGATKSSVHVTALDMVRGGEDGKNTLFLHWGKRSCRPRRVAIFQLELDGIKGELQFGIVGHLSLDVLTCIGHEEKRKPKRARD